MTFIEEKKTFLWKKQLLQRQGIQLLSKVLHHRQRQGTVIAAELTFQSHKIDPQVVGVEKPGVRGECDSKWLTDNDMQLYIVVRGTGGRLPVTIFPQIFHHYIASFFPQKSS